jgi:hypothetical protein
MEMNTGAVTGCAGPGNSLTPAHYGTRLDQQTAHVGIKGYSTVAMIDHQAVSIPTIPAGKDHFSLGCR